MSYQAFLKDFNELKIDIQNYTEEELKNFMLDCQAAMSTEEFEMMIKLVKLFRGSK